MNSTSSLLDDALGLTFKANQVILIEDCVETSGSFILHHLMKRSLSSEINGSIIFVSFSQPFSHYDRIMRKMGYNLLVQRDNKKLHFLDMMKLEYPDGNKDGLVGLYAEIQSAVEGSSSRNECVTVMIDDISLLEIAARGSINDVLDFLHYCVTLSSEQSCSLVLLTHEDVYPSREAPRLLSNLEYLADIVIKTEPLLTGLAADVHGQLTIIKKAIFDHKNYSAIKISNFHFKVKENGVEYFYPGSRH